MKPTQKAYGSLIHVPLHPPAVGDYGAALMVVPGLLAGLRQRWLSCLGS